MQEFAIRIKYLNPLPDVPFDPKLVELPIESDRDYKFQHSSLYETQNDLISDSTQKLDFLKMGYFERSFKNGSEEKLTPKTVDPKDLPLLTKPADASNKLKKRVIARPIVPWLRRTEYISSDIVKIRKEKKPMINNENEEKVTEKIDTSVPGQIKAIENTFNYFKDPQFNIKNIKHPTDKKKKIKEIFPIFPDFSNWPNQYSQVGFDSNPIPNNSNKLIEQVQSQESLLKAMVNPKNENDKFFSYYIPSESSVELINEKRKRLEEGDEEEDVETYEYNHVRDFNFDFKREDEGKKFFFIIQEPVVFYNPILGKAKLRRTRAK
ncbi:RNA polymerase-associated factor, partial [Clydaea vesicula]